MKRSKQLIHLPSCLPQSTRSAKAKANVKLQTPWVRLVLVAPQECQHKNKVDVVHINPEKTFKV